MKINKSEKQEILVKYYETITEQKTQSNPQAKYVYKPLPAVKEIQTKLKQLAAEIGNPNLDPGEIDGIFGDKTLRAFNTLASIRDDIVVYSPIVTKGLEDHGEWDKRVKSN